MKIKDILKLGGVKLSKEVMSSKVMIATGDTKMADFANKLWDLIVNTDYLRPSVHGVLVKGYSHKEASEIYGVKESYLRNLIGIEGDRLEEDLGVNALLYLTGELEFENRASVDALLTVLDGLISVTNWIEEDWFDRLTFDIRSKRTVRNSSLVDSDFIAIVQTLEFLSKPKMESKMEDIGDDTLGYIKYLLVTEDKNLTEREKTRKDIIKEVWWL